MVAAVLEPVAAGQPSCSHSAVDAARIVTGLQVSPSSTTDTEQQYLCYFMHRHLDFRHAEVESLAGMCAPSTSGRGMEWQEPYGSVHVSPFWHVRLPGDAVARSIAARAMLVKGFFEVWGEGGTWEELRTAIEAFPEHRKAPWLGAGVSWKVVVDGWGRNISQEETVEMVERLDYIPFQGPVRLSGPDVKFWLIEAHTANNCGLPAVPYRLYFGREVAFHGRTVISRYGLPQRRYLGPTSMDTEMAFIICNQARVRPHSLVYDPFVGTGSITIAAAVAGAWTLGADIDLRVVRDGKVNAQGEAVDVLTNFADYGLRPPVGLLRQDAHTPAFRPGLEEVLDAVVCDPPYGVRAGGRKSVAKEHLVRNSGEHIPSTDPYTLGECLHDLLDQSARHLRIGGRLVYFLPATPETYREEDVPRHPALRVVANSEQILSSRYSRRLITMEKVVRYDAAAAQAHFTARGSYKLAIDDVHAIVYESRPTPNGMDDTASERLTTKIKYRGKNL